MKTLATTTKVKRGSSNVFADLNLPDPDKYAARAELALRLRGFSTDRLLRFLIDLDRDIEIIVSKKPASRRHAQINVVSR
jgi:hypothetical protein